MKLQRLIVLTILILSIIGITLLNRPTPQASPQPSQLATNVIEDLYKAPIYDSIPTTTLYNFYTASGLWFFHHDKLALAVAQWQPVNDTYTDIVVKFKEGEYSFSNFVKLLSLYTAANMPGQQFVFSVYPYDSHVTSNEYREIITIAVGYTKYDEATGKYQPWIDLASSNLVRDQTNLIDWNVVSGSIGYDSYLSAEGYWLEFDSNRYPIDAMRRTIYQVPKTIYSSYPFSNALPTPIAFDNIIVYDTVDAKYKVYTVVDSWYFLYTPVQAGGMQYIIKYVDNLGNLVNDTVGQKIPLLYLDSPLVTVQYKHLDLLMLKLLENGNIQFILSGVFFYNPQDSTATIDNKVRVLYDIPGVSPGATCYVSTQQTILPTTMNPYTTKAYLLTEEVEMISWVDAATGVTKFALKAPIRIGLYDPANRLFAILRINNVTMYVRDNIAVTDLCHYGVESIDFALESVYDLSTIVPNDQAAEITMFDISSPRAKYYGPMFFRIGLYDSVVSYNPTKVLVYRYTGSGWDIYIIEGRITPLAIFYRDKVLPEKVSFTWYGSSLLPFVQSDYNGQSVTRVQYEYFIVVPIQNITATPRMFTHTIEYNYTITPIDITYIKYNPDEPDSLTNVLVLLNITDPTILSSIATSDGRDIRFFEDNTRAGDYWLDTGLVYGIEEYVPGQWLTVYVLIPSLYANQTKTIYMYTGFPYAQPVAQSVETLLASYPVLVPTSS